MTPDALRAELDSLMRELPCMERMFKQLKTAAKRRSLAAEIVSRLQRVIAIEQLGIYIESDDVFPSQWLREYQSEHDWAAVEVISNQFDTLWDDLYFRPQARATLQKLQRVKALAEATRPQLFSAEWIAPLQQQISVKLQEITLTPCDT